jgi:ankyrin repeat protein
MNSEELVNINILNQTDLDASINSPGISLFDPNLQDNPSILNSEQSHNNSKSELENLFSSRSTNLLDSESNNLLSEITTDFPLNNNINKTKPTSNLNSELSNTENQNISNNLVVNWKDEIYKGNFMPAFYLLDQGKISVDDIIEPNTQNRLLHLALSFSYTNVTRGLIELFKCNLNPKNLFGHTPFHILCNNEQNDIFLFSYLLKNEDLLFDEKDRTGVTPLFFSIISKHNLAFLLLLFKKANIYNVDDMGNNALYFALSADNKFALNFILRHCAKLGLNARFFANKASLSEVLISQKGRKISKHFVKYFHHKLHLEAIIASQKQKSQFNFYNNFNYDLFNTLYFYKTKNYIGFISKLLSKNPLSCYTYAYYNFKFLLYDLLLPNMNENLKYFLIASYCTYISYLFFDLLNTSNILVFDNSSLSFLSAKALMLIYQTSSIICLFASLLRFFFSKTPKAKTCFFNEVSLSIPTERNPNPFYADEEREEGYTSYFRSGRENKIKEPYYDYSNCLYNSDNALNMLYQAAERNPLDLFFDEELCEICLIKKSKCTNHCYVCNRCVKEFYFHSKFFNVCFHRKNIYYYILFFSSLMAIHVSFILFMVYKISSEFFKAENPQSNLDEIPQLSLYQSEYFLTNLVTFLVSLSVSRFVFVLVCFVLGVLFFQRWAVMFLCIGYRVTYYNMFRIHKKAVGKLEQRQGKICNIPEVNTVSLCDFVRNIFRK